MHEIAKHIWIYFVWFWKKIIWSGRDSCTCTMKDNSSKWILYHRWTQIPDKTMKHIVEYSWLLINTLLIHSHSNNELSNSVSVESLFRISNVVFVFVCRLNLTKLSWANFCYCAFPNVRKLSAIPSNIFWFYVICTMLCS